MAAPASGGIDLRPARDDPEDRRYVWEVNNDPSVRERAIDTDDIPWRDHVAWYADVLSDPTRLLFVARHAGRDCGVVRYDLDPEAGEAEITIALAQAFRGRHLGRRIIRRSASTVLERPDVKRIVAHVRPDNAPSLRAFRGAGYVGRGRVEVRGADMLRLEFPDD